MPTLPNNLHIFKLNFALLDRHTQVCTTFPLLLGSPRFLDLWPHNIKNQEARLLSQGVERSVPCSGPTAPPWNPQHRQHELLFATDLVPHNPGRSKLVVHDLRARWRSLLVIEYIDQARSGYPPSTLPEPMDKLDHCLLCQE